MTEHQLTHLFMDDEDGIGLCGCGNPEEGARLVRDILRLCPLYDNRKAFEALLPNIGVQMLILGLLDGADLIEHGGGIGGSWLTDKGIEVRDSLNALSEDAINEMFDSEQMHGEKMAAELLDEAERVRASIASWEKLHGYKILILKAKTEKANG